MVALDIPRTHYWLDGTPHGRLNCLNLPHNIHHNTLHPSTPPLAATGPRRLHGVCGCRQHQDRGWRGFGGGDDAFGVADNAFCTTADPPAGREEPHRRLLGEEQERRHAPHLLGGVKKELDECAEETKRSLFSDTTQVDNIHKAVEDLKAKNIRSLDPKPKVGAHGKPVVFLHPKVMERGGTYIRFIDADRWAWWIFLT